MDALMDALTESVVSELCAALDSARDSVPDRPGGMAAAFRGWALDHPASFRLVLGLNGRRTGSQGLIGRLPHLQGASPSTLYWAALCGLALLELGCEQEDLSPLYAAAAGLGALPQLSTREVDGAAAGGGCCAVPVRRKINAWRMKRSHFRRLFFRGARIFRLKSRANGSTGRSDS